MYIYPLIYLSQSIKAIYLFIFLSIHFIAYLFIYLHYLSINSGLTGWLLHGTSCQLASMFNKTAIANLQIGFRLPEIYTILISSSLQLGELLVIYVIILYVHNNT